MGLLFLLVVVVVVVVVAVVGDLMGCAHCAEIFHRVWGVGVKLRGLIVGRVLHRVDQHIADRQCCPQPCGLLSQFSMHACANGALTGSLVLQFMLVAFGLGENPLHRQG